MVHAYLTFITTHVTFSTNKKIQESGVYLEQQKNRKETNIYGEID